MSWHACGHLIQRDFSSNPNLMLEVLGHSHLESQGPMDFEDAMTPGDINGCYLGFIDDWTIVFDYSGYLTANGIKRTEHAMTMAAESPLSRLTPDSAAFSFFLEGYANIAAFSWYQYGKIARSLYIEGENVLLDIGITQPQEYDIFKKAPNNEQAIVSLLESLTLPIDRFSAIEYDYYLPD